MGVKRNLVVPAHIAECWRLYNGTDFRAEAVDQGFPDKIVALRSAFEWYAVLMQTKDGQLWAVDFTGYSTDPAKWSVQNDSIDFETIEEFTKGKLERSFF
jgi:hypothetical protein